MAYIRTVALFCDIVHRVYPVVDEWISNMTFANCGFPSQSARDAEKVFMSRHHAKCWTKLRELEVRYDNDNGDFVLSSICNNKVTK